jgi:MFS transporter, Spinster family, sphingosine-1-phosphate transporter
MSAPAPRIEAYPGAKFAVGVLTAMNLLNYVDRYVPSAVKDLFKRDLGMTDAQTSYPLTAFVIVYMVTSPMFGALSDRYPRKVLIAAGVAFWSLATGAAAFSTGIATFLIARALVGVGEAAYATISPPLLSDFYPPSKRNRVLTIFYVAIPLGAAVGFMVGGVVAETLGLGWRAAFMVVGFPGLLASALVLLVKDPGRGTFDEDAAEKAPGWREAIPMLLKNHEYLFSVGGYVAVTFASGALADWFATFLVRHRDFTLAAADAVVGNTAVVGGLAGTAVGGLLADWLKGRTRNPYLAVCGLSMCAATICAVIALNLGGKVPIVTGILLAQFFLWFYNGPVNTVLVNCVPSRLRVRAFALSILAIHALGDAVSPSVVGKASDSIGLKTAIQLVPIAMGIGALIWLYAWRRLPERAQTYPA